MPIAPQEHRAKLIIPVAAFIAILPLLLQGCSCGHDFDFHILNWFEAARQFTHGNLHPTWAYTPAYNAGEPRFVFYPPLSWTIGAILGLIFPWATTPIIYTWLALTSAGLSLYYFAKEFTTQQAALIAATFYTVNPYMLFTAYERTAYAELLAAAWIPLLLHAILRGDDKGRVTIPRIAIPIALLWLTNAPAAVMSCYTLALLTLIRIILAITRTVGTTKPGAPYLDSEMWASRTSATAPAHPPPDTKSPQTNLQLAATTTAGTALGLGLAAFYILPAAYERRYVQIAMAILPGLHPQDNFLFHRTGTSPDQTLHDTVLHTASIIAILLLTLTTIALIITYRSTNKPGAPSFAHSAKGGVSRQSATALARPNQLLLPLAILSLTIAFLLTPLSSPIWNHAPELAFLQFPWRFVAILAAALSLTLALAIKSTQLKPKTTTLIALATAAALTYPAYLTFHQPCDEEDTIPARLALFHSNQGTDPSDEYTPITADNDSLAHTNPPYWLSPDDPNAPAQTNSTPGPAPTHLTLTSPTPQTLILNLRDYPTWRITLNNAIITTREQRDDGLIALPIPAGQNQIDITSTHLRDQTIGYIITAIAIFIMMILHYRRTTKATNPQQPLA